MSSDAISQFATVRLGNDLIDSYSQNPGRPGTIHTITTVNSSGAFLRNIQYAFDPNMNLQTRQDAVLNTQQAIEYGAVNRLVRWIWAGTAGPRKVRWDYDDIGNIRRRAVESGPGNDLVYTYDTKVAGPHAVVETNLGAYAYDVKGNQVSAPGRSVLFGRGELPTRVQHTTPHNPKNVTFIYDGENARIRTIDEAAGVTLDSIDGLYEFRRSNGATGYNGEHVFNVVVGGRLIARRLWTFVDHKLEHNLEEFVHSDHQGSIELVTSGKRDVLERLKYDPFGMRVHVDDPSKHHVKRSTDLQTGYTAQEQLDTWLLIDMKGRFYDPTIAKFISADPFVPDVFNPQAWNRYAYVLNNPLTLRDPTGFDDADDSSSAQDAPGSPYVPRPDHMVAVYESTVWAPRPSPPGADGYGGAGPSPASKATPPPLVTTPAPQKPVAPATTRGLSTKEILEAETIFGDQIDHWPDDPTAAFIYNEIVIQKGGFAATGATRTVGSVIYMQDRFFQPGSLDLTPSGRSTLFHELTHVWQYQHQGYGYAPASLAAQLWAWLTTGTRNSAYDYQAAINDKPFYQWNPEQQARLVEDYYNLKHLAASGYNAPGSQSKLLLLENFLSEFRSQVFRGGD